jgi:coiled-coil and C2 domain-containing protein 2A
VSPAPVLSSVVEVSHVRVGAEGNAAPPPPERVSSPSPPSSTAVATAATAPRPPDAFAAPGNSADPLLAGLQLAQERLAFHLSQSADTGFYHGGAMTSLVVPVEPPPPPPLRRDVIDVVAASSPQQQQPPAVDPPSLAAEEKQKKKHHGAAGDSDHTAKKLRRRRHVSRRHREHARRIEAALHTDFAVEMCERALPVPPRSSPAGQEEVVVVLESSSTSRSSSGGGDNKNNSRHNGRRRAAPEAAEGTRETRKARRHPRDQQRQQQQQPCDSASCRQPSTTTLDLHLRDLPPAGDGEAAADAEIDSDERYRPDDEGASQLLEERMRLLQGQQSDDADARNALHGYAAYVRPAEHFQRGPVPQWVEQFSNVLLFDQHRLDPSDAAAMRRMQTTAGGAETGVSVRVQLPVDAVVLRLRGDIARARQLRDQLMRDRGCRRGMLFPGTLTRRYEVYHPAELDWGPPPPQKTAAATSNNNSSSSNDATSSGLPPDSCEVVVGAADASDEGTGKSRRTPVSQHSPLLLSRNLEAKDLQRPLLAQTIPAWRRRGAAVKFVSDLISLLEDRLHAFGKQLDDPVRGPALELIGAPDSSGVDGTVRNTYPPALERAMLTTITNTLLSDLFATSYSALGSRALRLSEALRRRQTPYVHDVYVTQFEGRPVYDYTALTTARSSIHGYCGARMGGREYGRHVHGSTAAAAGGGAALGVDARRSYSIHVDYVRFQPSVESAAMSLLRNGSHGISAQRGSGSVSHGHSAAGTPAASSRRSTLLSSSAEPFSSLLLGSYISVFAPRDKAAGGASSSSADPATAAAHRTAGQPHGNTSNEEEVEGGGTLSGGPLGTDNVDATTAALLLALSTATNQCTLVPFSLEEYLTSLLLRYYEQYRMLQLNLLPSLKSRFFYQEQLAQLQRQPRRSTELNQLQARLESLAQTSANVERGCLHVMIVLWNAVLEQRRRQRQQRRLGGSTPTAADMHGADITEAEDPPIIVHHRGSAERRSHGSHAHPPRQPRSAPPPPTTPEERRTHPPLFGEDPAGLVPAPVVHSVFNTVTDDDDARQQQSRFLHNNSSASSSGDNSVAPPPRPLFFSPTPPDVQAASAQASPLLAPPLHVAASTSSSAHSNNISNSSSSGNNNNNIYYNNRGSGTGLTEGIDACTPPAATRFRFFLRRYGTTEEVPYTMGDDLLWYAAEVEGTDVTPSAPPAAAQPSAAGRSADELLYFQLVVFTRTRAAMVPQYVGCTTPRPMTTAKVVFFNETFEIRAMHEPAEILLHVIPVTAGPSRMTVVSTVRLRPTLTRRYTLLPLQPPTAFMFHGKLFTRNHNTTLASGAAGGNAARRGTTSSNISIAPLSGVVAVSTTWTSSQGLTVAQMEQIFLRGADGGAGGDSVDPLDPQYLPILRALRSYYAEQDATRGSTKGRSDDDKSQQHQQSRSRGRRDRRGAAVRDATQRLHETGGTAWGAGAGGNRKSRSDVVASPQPHRLNLGRRTSSALSLLRQRNAAASLQRQLTTLGPSTLFSAAAARNASFRVPRAGVAVTPAAAVAAGEGGVHAAAATTTSLSAPLHAMPLMVLTAAAAGAHDYTVEEVQQRLPTVRLQYLFRRWLTKVGRIKPADEVESRLLERPIPLDDADVYLERKRVLRLVETEDAARREEYSASGVQFDAERYYKAPSAISGLALSNLPREMKLQLWRERQRRLLLTRQAKRHMSDAEKLEAIVKVPKLVMTMVFDFAPRSQLNPHRKVRPKTEEIDRALLKRRQDSHIVVHIMKAHHLPYRADGTPLEPFVQVSFVSEAAYTRSEVGSSPSWFETLELPFQPLDFEEDTLSMIDDDIVISLYDKVEVKMSPSSATTAAVAHETHYRTERRFIGTLRIPFYSLHQASEARMEGVYPLRTPRWLLGYDLLNATDELVGANGNGAAAPAGVGGGAGANEGSRMAVDASLPWASSLAAVPPVGFTDNNNNNDSSRFAASEGASKENPFRTTELVDGSGSGRPCDEDGGPAVPAAAADVDVRAIAATDPTVQLYISLWPPLQRDPPKKLSKAELHRRVKELFVSPQLHYLHRVALQWQQTALKRVKSIAAMNAQATVREIEPFVECSTGDLVLVCRYMLHRGGPPPPSVRTPYEAIRYVSLLPFVADMMSFGEKDVWSTNAELLAMRSGDYEELALLLVHFLRYLAPGRPSYAVVGSGTIYQQTILVLHEFEDKELYLIDPRSGWTVPAGKPYGTLLRDVSMVISHDQLWANTQLSGLPHRMSWDLHNPAHWLPCFDSARDRRIPACIPHLCPIQREVLEFPPADSVKSREIEVELRACLRRALLMWRNGCPPAYHRGVEAILRELLEAAEAERCTCGSARRTDITRSAAARLGEYFGEPVTGEPVVVRETAAAHQQRPSPRRARSSRRRRHHDSRNGQGDREEEVEADGNGQDGKTEEPTPSSPPAMLRVLGSPVMGSYNPADAQFEELLQQVFEGAVHEVGTTEVSFAAGIYVKSYTGDVCAMWVFLVAICRG